MLRRRFLSTAKAVAAASTTASTTAAATTLPPLITAAAVIGGANAVGFGISATTGSHLHLDIIGTGCFGLAALATGGGDLRQQISSGCIALWATKLASFLGYRAFQTGHDGRLDNQLSTTYGAYQFWAISFVWGFVVSLPHVLAAGVPLVGRPKFGSPTDYLGLGLFALGLAIETAADLQKWYFKQDASNRGKFCDVGVWQISQHPNWFGNIVLWTGITLLNVQTLLAGKSLLRKAGRLLGATLSPLFMVALFYAQATDTIAKTQALADEKYGHDPVYKRWVSTTPLIVPTFESVKRLFV